MKKLGRYGPMMKRVPPVGVISKPDEAAAVIAVRARKGTSVVVFVDDGYVYAVTSNSMLSDLLPLEAIVGKYTSRAPANDIAGDIDAWRKAA